MASDADLPRSTKNLWVLLSGSSLIKSREFIGTELTKHSSLIISGLLTFKCRDKSKDVSSELAKYSCLQDVPIELIEKMSLLLDLSVIQCYELFCSYLLFGFKGTPNSIKSLFMTDKSIKHLLSQLWHYYYTERLFAILCLKQILSYWQQTSTHPYRELFRDYLGAANKEDKILINLLEQFKILSSKPMPSRMTHGSYFNDDLAKSWINYNMKEQSEILQLLMLHFKNIDVNSKHIIKLLELFEPQSHNYERPNDAHHYQPQSIQLSSCVNEEMIKFMNFLKSIIIVECFDLIWLFQCQEQDMHEQHPLFKDEASLKVINSKIVKLNNTLDYHSPIFLAWMLVRSWELPGFDATSSGDIVRHLGKNAIQLDIFAYLHRSVQLSPFLAMKNTPVGDLIHTVIANIVSVTFSLYSIEETNFPMTFLYDLCEILFKNDTIASELFTNGLDSGLGVVIRSALRNFPLESNTALRFCCSLAQTNSCSRIFKEMSILSNLTNYTEIFDMTSSFMVPTLEYPTQTSYTLKKDKFLYHNKDLVIKAGTHGLIKNVKNNQTGIEWREININGWKVLYCRFSHTLDLILQGQYHAISGQDMNEIKLICILSSNLVRRNCHLHIPIIDNLIKLCFDAFDTFSSLQFPPREFMSSVLQLSACIINELPKKAQEIWSRITSKHFIPYMIGLTNDLKELSNGKDTNPCILGQMIASEECIRGNYDLCIAYLTLISQLIEFKEFANDEHLLAGVIYILNEIFPSYHGWNYMCQHDCNSIGRLCLDIFHKVLTMQTKNYSKNLKLKHVGSKLESVCMLSLMEGPAAEKMLNIIKVGESVVRDAIIESGSDVALISNDKILIVRQALSVFNRLLVLHDDTISSTKVIESALFSSQFKPNMLLTLAHYFFQRYDTKLASHAVLILKRLAKKFPMSLLACLGSEAEAIKDHFLFRLDAVTEDLRLKMVLLDFLSVCVQHQPGLMEMFLNTDDVDNDSNNETYGCLHTVLEILQEKMDGKYDCPFELHCSALKFIYTFWLQPHLLAINSLKNTKNVWTLITFPMLEKDHDFNPKLCTYILRILAREIFYIKTLDRKSFDSELELKFKSLIETGQLTKLSSYISSIVCTINSDSEDAYSLLDSWKDFLVSLSKFDPFNLTKDVKVLIANDLFGSLLALHSQSSPNHQTLSILTDTSMMIIQRWKQDCIDDFKSWNEKNIKILNCINERRENLPFSLMISSQVLLIEFLEIIKEKKIDSIDNNILIECVLPACELVSHSLRILEKQIKSPGKSLATELKNANVSISLLKTLIDMMANNHSLWLQIVRSHSIFESITRLLLFLVKHKIGLELAVSVICLFITFSKIEAAAEVLQSIGLMDILCMQIHVVYAEDDDEKNRIKVIKEVEESWIYVFHLTLKLVTTLLDKLGHHFIETAISFIAIHFDHIQSVLQSVRRLPMQTNVQECLLIVHLMHSLSHYSKLWSTNDPLLYQTSINEILRTSNSIIAFVIRPTYFSHMLENPHLASKSSDYKKVSPKQGLEERALNLRKSISFSWDEDKLSSLPENVIQIRDGLFKVLAFCLSFVKNMSPNILQLLEHQGYDNQQGNELKLLLDINFSTPNIDADINLSFGSLICAIQTCIKAINKNDKSSCSSTHVLTHIFEVSMSLLVSQSMVALFSIDVKEMEKQLISREFKAELTSILSSQTHFPKRSSQSMSFQPHKSPSIQIIEQRYMKILVNFVEKLQI